MFENVGNAGRVSGWRPETDGEEVFAIVAMEVQDLCHRYFMLDLIGGHADFRDLLNPENPETVPFPTDG